MNNTPSFSLPHFLPYLLNQAAETVSKDFQSYYRDRYGMLRTEWRVLFHLGIYGEMSAKDICEAASIHKTKVSRAVTALEQKRFLRRETGKEDRRTEHLSLTQKGQSAFADLHAAAARYEEGFIGRLTRKEIETLRRILVKLATGPTSASQAKSGKT